MKPVVYAAAALLLAAGAARAEVSQRSDTGFRVTHTVEIAAPPASIYAALGEVGRWWDDDHTFSGKAANLSLAMEPGGCFCERLEGGGGVRHAVVILARPSSSLRLEGALGPLQGEGVATALNFDITPKGDGGALTLTYTVGGYRPEGVKQWADGVDQVLKIQLDRLERYVETGKP